ncbi:hypothetical protein QTH87_13785 [Variovorax sp. J22P168]|uniref:hypothetical protein n=1 Tax=Variovorax jilinensis TaxID=3053513 RepID=UPI0025788292|nr:hypothetical protein [Variovorax sp. J22P168]MDM0013508.1 hypothetical protein [Variovorax sp. J22P168]
MNATHTPAHKADLAVTHVLAQLLERLEHSAVPVGPEQYRSVVLHLVEQFRDVEYDAELGRLLDAYPAASQLYENLNYQHAGLSRSALDTAVAAELAARKAIEAAMGHAKPDAAHE